MIIVDAHQDIASNWLEERRDYRNPALKTRHMEDNSNAALELRGYASNGLPDALIGRIGVVFGTIFACPAGTAFAHPNNAYRDGAEAFQLGMTMLDYYHRLNDEDDRIILLREQKDLDETLATWADGKTVGDHKVGILISMEGAEPIREPREIELWYERGLRAIGPAWDETRYSGSAYTPGPLTDLGRELLDVMASYQMLLDLSHMSEKASLEALDRYAGPLIASHSNPRRFIDRERMLSDEQIMLLAERDGVVGAVLFNLFIKKGWTRNDRKTDVTLADYIAIIDYICQLTGDSRHVGIGSDIDGGFGTEAMPAEIDTTSDFVKIAVALHERGYGEDDVQRIMGGNFLRKVREVLPT
ncbi:MAG: membrane dipeptidase [Chloroflexi bacterium]|nr:membrane dipeptidase [Chloroflexota bacterium]